MRALSGTLPPAYWALTSGLVLTLGDIVLRSWFETGWHYGCLTAFLIYMLGIICIMLSFFGKNIAVATVLAVISNAVMYLLISHWKWGDTISMQQGIGVALGLIAFAVLELS